MEALSSTCPATGEHIWSGAVATRDDVVRTVERARRAFSSWRSVSVEERTSIARNYASILKSWQDQFATTIARETGKPLWEAKQEVGSMIGKVELSISAQAERAGERRVDAPFGQTVLRHRPHGVVAVLGPYNFPGHLPNGHIVPALLAGNVVIFKPSELTPAVGAEMARAWADAGLPEDVLTVIQGRRDTGEALVEAEIDGLLFTGSAATGMHFRRRFADRPDVIVALELGGNNPLVVWDGDIAEAAALVVQSAFVTTGQRCSCARRLIVPEGKFAEALVDAIASLAERLPIGSWDEVPEPYIGPLVSAQAAATARGQVDHLSGLGGRVIRPLDRVPGRGPAFVTPAVIDVTGIDAPDEEIFAPVVQLIKVRDFESALEAANNTRFGLSAGLVSRDRTLWERFVTEVRAGVVNWNRPTTGAAGGLPFGGVGESGNHRPSAFYAADYCAFPTASFEAPAAASNLDALPPSVRL